MSKRPTADDVAPVFLVKDIHQSVDWYTNKLGFEVEKVWGEPPAFAMADFGLATIMLKQSANGPRTNHESDPNMWDAYFWVSKLKKLEQAFRENGVDIHRGPEETGYGFRELEIRDPDGHILCFGKVL